MAPSTRSWVACIAGGIAVHMVRFWRQSRCAKRVVKPFRDFCTLLMPPPAKQHSHTNPASYKGYLLGPSIIIIIIIAKKAYSQVDKIITVLNGILCDFGSFLICISSMKINAWNAQDFRNNLMLGWPVHLSHLLSRSFEFHPSFNFLRQLYK